jgi:hypothetical protein
MNGARGNWWRDGERQKRKKQQIPGGNDRKKGKSKGKGNGKDNGEGKDNGNGNYRGPSLRSG